jgi:hypothetical protein
MKVPRAWIGAARARRNASENGAAAPAAEAAPALDPPAGRRGTAAALATIGHAATELASRGTAVARRHPLEAAALFLLGVGGLILPFPFWLAGATVALWSRIWGRFDKWAAFLGPLVLRWRAAS